MTHTPPPSTPDEIKAIIERVQNTMCETFSNRGQFIEGRISEYDFHKLIAPLLRTNQPSDESREALECPACKGKAQIKGRAVCCEEYFTVYSIECSKCWVRTDSRFNTPQEAMAVWNFRGNIDGEENE
jgi:hypothetical protein